MEHDFESFDSVLPFMPPVEEDTMQQYRLLYAGLVALIILFGGLVAPVLEVKLGLGGTTLGPLLQAVRGKKELLQLFQGYVCMLHLQLALEGCLVWSC